MAVQDPGKPFGLPAVFAIATGAMISSGLFVLPGLAFELAGPSVVLAYFIAALLCLPALFSMTELATAMPRAGSSYFAVERSMGTFAGTMAGLVNWVSVALKAAFAFVGIGAMALLVRPDLGETGLKAVAVGSCLAFGLVNLLSVRGAGHLQGGLVAALLGILAAFCFGGATHVDPFRFTPFFGTDPWGFMAVVGLVFVSYGGLAAVVDVGGEIREPGTSLPRGMFLAFGVVNVLYVGVVAVTVGVLPAETLAGSLAPVTQAAELVWGGAGAVLVGLAAFLAYATTGNAGLLSASRSPVAMSHDGLLPEVLGRVDRAGTPVVAVATTTAVICATIAFLSVLDLVKVASTMYLLRFLAANLAVIIMRSSPLEGYRPTFRVPLCPWLPAGGILVYGILIAEMGTVPLLTTGIFLGAGALWSVLYVDPQLGRVAALAYTARRIMARTMERTGLEDELLAISLERDQITPDRFDMLVGDAPVLDLSERVPARELFRRLAEVLAPRLRMPQVEIERLFVQREGESSTVIAPHLAIPHIIVPGEGYFDLVLVRCSQGVVFSDLHPPVHAVFALLGSEDERNFHLKALVAVATIVQAPDFDGRWLGARNEEQLRDVVLLSRRRRGAGA